MRAYWHVNDTVDPKSTSVIKYCMPWGWWWWQLISWFHTVCSSSVSGVSYGSLSMSWWITVFSACMHIHNKIDYFHLFPCNFQDEGIVNEHSLFHVNSNMQSHVMCDSWLLTESLLRWLSVSSPYMLMLRRVGTTKLEYTRIRPKHIGVINLPVLRSNWVAVCTIICGPHLTKRVLHNVRVEDTGIDVLFW